MTIKSFIERRQSKVLSKQNVAHVKAVLTSAKTLLANAGEEDDTLPLVGGPDGTLSGGQATAATTVQDGTGVVRAAGVMRTITGNVEVR